MRRALAALVILAACKRAAPAPASLADYLAGLAGADEATRRAAVASWKIDRDGWARLTTDPYRAEYDEYVEQFQRSAPGLIAQLAHAGPIEVRPHYAGDSKLTLGQARTRWAQPVQAPSEIAELAGAPIDAVFVQDGGGWRVFVGVDVIVFLRTAAHDVKCATRATRAVTGRCSDAAWVVAEGALRNDVQRLTRACARLQNLCPDP